jgi:hypothetical protein
MIELDELYDTHKVSWPTTETRRHNPLFLKVEEFSQAYFEPFPLDSKK